MKFPTFVVATEKANRSLCKAIRLYNRISGLYVASAAMMLVLGTASSFYLLQIQASPDRTLVIACTVVAWLAAISLAGCCVVTVIVRRALRNKAAVRWSRAALRLMQYTLELQGQADKEAAFLDWIGKTDQYGVLQEFYDTWQQGFTNTDASHLFIRQVKALVRDFKNRPKSPLT